MLTPEVRNPETQTHFVHSGGRDFCTAFHRESPTKENLRTAFGKQLLCERLILTHRSHIKRRCIKVFSSSLIPGVSIGRRFFLLQRRDKGTTWGRRKARAICRVSKSLLDAGRVPECRSAAVKPYDLRQVCSTVRNRSECRNP